MGRSLDDLCSCIRPQFDTFLKRAAEELGFVMIVVGTGRTQKKQSENIANLVSFTVASKHLPQPVCHKSHAGDVVPQHLSIKKRWAPEDPDWLRLGLLGEDCGLRWGGRWAGNWHRDGDPHSREPDCPHFDVAVIHPPPAPQS